MTPAEEGFVAKNPESIAPSDKELVGAVLDGDLSSFGPLVERYWQMATALALNKIKDSVEAEDVAQESFIKAYSQLHRLRDRARFAGWLSKIVIQECTNSFRRRARHTMRLNGKTGAQAVLSAGLTPSTNPGLINDQAHLVREVVSRLPEKFRNIVIMRFIGGLSTTEIAEQLGKRHGTVRVWLHRAYNILRKDLAPLVGEVESL